MPYHTFFLYLAPSEIRFSQDSIGKYFKDGGLVNDLVEAICCGTVEVDQIPPIHVTKKRNKYYSSDNRRLYVFRVLQKRGKVQKIRVRYVDGIWDERMTTTNDGREVKVRYDKTLPHTFHTDYYSNDVQASSWTRTESAPSYCAETYRGQGNVHWSTGTQPAAREQDRSGDFVAFLIFLVIAAFIAFATSSLK